MKVKMKILEKMDFVLIYAAANLFGLLSIILTFIWCLLFGGGFGFRKGALLQWHPFFMSIGLIYLMGNAILTFRILRNKHKYTLKLMHTAANATGLIFTLLSFAAAYATFTIHFYSIHAWIGMIVIGFYIIQAIVSVAAFLFNAVSNESKALLLPFHIYFGHLIFILGIVAAVSGINEKALMRLSNHYSALETEAVLLNFIALMYIIFGALVVYISTNIRYKRYSRDEDVQMTVH